MTDQDDDKLIDRVAADIIARKAHELGVSPSALSDEDIAVAIGMAARSVERLRKYQKEIASTSAEDIVRTHKKAWE